MKIWSVELDLYHELERVCNKHGIRFTVFAGTLLGAIRHNGFIPGMMILTVVWREKNMISFLK